MAYLFFKPTPIEAAVPPESLSGSPSKQFPKPGRHRGLHPQQQQERSRFYNFGRRVIMRRWTRWLKALAVMAVITQMSMIGIATVKLGNSSSLYLFSAADGEPHQESRRIHLFEAFKHEFLDPRRGLQSHLRQDQHQQHQQHHHKHRRPRQHRNIPVSEQQELADLANERHHSSPETQEFRIRQTDVLRKKNATVAAYASAVLPRAQPNATAAVDRETDLVYIVEAGQPKPNATAAIAAPLDEPDLVHIIHTRFMQHQGNLTTLGIARLKQFLAFCLPTMVHQTTQDFIWLIKVDPLLEEHPESRAAVLEPLLEAIQNNNNNIYVVASNFNFNIEGHGGSWRDGQEGNELLLPPSSSENSTVRYPTGARVYTGDLERLRKAHELRERVPVLETRLDADDGLNLKYLERVQDIARNRFLGSTESGNDEDDVPPHPSWLYWCILTQIEWHSEPYSNTPYTNSTRASPDAASPDYWEIRNREKKYYGNSRRGYVVPMANGNFCITPGLTVGYGIGTTEDDVPRYPHTDLYQSLHDKHKFCHSKHDKTRDNKGPCLERVGGVKVTNGKTSYAIHALRSRTLTSAGMDGVGNSDGNSTTNNTETNKAATTQKQHINNTQSSVGSSADAAGPEQKKEEEEVAKKMESILWRVLQERFAIDLTEVRATQRFLQDHRQDIALENSLGQCSTGHSCKDKARERLRTIAKGRGQTQTKERPATA